MEYKKELFRYGLLFLVFLIGLAIPSPFFRSKTKITIESKLEEHVDTINMEIDGGLYIGSIIRNSHVRDGYGRFIIQAGTSNETVYEGDWKNDKLRFGTRTTYSSIYTGHFDDELNNDGFGIINYSEAYIRGKSSQGLPDSEIIVTYIGNWSNNYKQGLGRLIKKDGSMDFGKYSGGSLQRSIGANYRIGGSVYGIDVSHWQTDIDWNNLALYCDKNGNVLCSPNPTEMTYLQPVFFAYIKATEGATVKDEMYNVRMIEAERHGIVKGAYHFLRLGSPVDDQLKNFFETVTWNLGDLPPALDIESVDEVIQYGDETMKSMALEWLEKVEKKMGVCPIIYTNQEFQNTYLNDSRFNKYKFWIAKHSEEGPDKFDWQIWQNSAQGKISGCKGDVDIDIFRGDYDLFKLYLQSVGAQIYDE